MFVPTTKSELVGLKWDSCDIIFVSGDVYIDSPYDGVALLAKLLIKHGYKVGIISQPELNSPLDITRLGSPNLFWGVSGGCVDSMVSNFTAVKKRRRTDDLTPGGENNRRPDRAVIKYVNLIKQFFKSSKPVVIGGIEASLRRVAHFDYWDEKLRRSVLVDSKADFLVYGMGEMTILEIAESFATGREIETIRGLCYLSSDPENDYIELPSYEDVLQSKAVFSQMFMTFYENNDPLNAKGLYQKHGNRYVVQNPPQFYPSQEELDSYYNLDFEYDAHPYYKSQGVIKALDTIKQSITTHRGCFGECNFCAIAVHQGRKIISRSEQSVMNEVIAISNRKNFNGIIYDLGGPSANMYKMNCKKQDKLGSCKDRRCIYPHVCSGMNISHKSYTDLIKKVSSMPMINKVFIGSGLRFDLVLRDEEFGREFMAELVADHVSGQLKIAPEHTSPKVLRLMGKNISWDDLLEFKEEFQRLSKKYGKKQFLTYYIIAAHPGCSIKENQDMKEFIKTRLKAKPEQVQIFTPTPSTISTLMYYTGIDPYTNAEINTEKNLVRKNAQKVTVTTPNWKLSKARYNKF